MRTLYIEFIGRPGAGKSTTAFGIFSELKYNGFKTEFVNEYAKELVYKGHTKELDNQLAVTAEQNYREDVLNGVVDIVVTDTSLLLGLIYNNTLDANVMESLVNDIRKDKHYLTIFLSNKNNEYQEYGRTQTKEEAAEIADDIFNLLESRNLNIIRHDKSEGSGSLYNKIMQYLEESL